LLGGSEETYRTQVSEYSLPIQVLDQAPLEYTSEEKCCEDTSAAKYNEFSV
jgi:hypothetical protein